MNKAVIFDMDGLMLDTKLTWKEGEREMLSDLGKEYDLEIAKKYQGMRVSGVVEVMIRDYNLSISQEQGVKILTEKLVKKYDNPSLALFDGCKDLVESLNRTGEFAIAIASSSPKIVIEKMAKRFGIKIFFDLFVSGEEVENGKPAPDIYLMTAKLLKVLPKDCIVLEDAPHGATAGKKAGMKVIAVYNKVFYEPRDFMEVADLIVDSSEKVNPAVVNKLLQ
jgi:HAD superfamily hydrolase (TIGR01509 family)